MNNDWHHSENNGQDNYGHSAPRHHPPQGGPYRQPEKASDLATATLVLGIGSWFFIPIVGALAAVVCGMIERKKIARGESSEAGSGMVTVGLILGGIQLAITALGMLLVIGFFALIFMGLAFV